MPHSPKPLTCSGVLQSWSRGGQAKASNKQIKRKVLSSVCVASHPCGLFDWRAFVGGYFVGTAAPGAYPTSPQASCSCM